MARDSTYLSEIIDRRSSKLDKRLKKMWLEQIDQFIDLLEVRGEKGLAALSKLEACTLPDMSTTERVLNSLELERGIYR